MGGGGAARRKGRGETTRKPNGRAKPHDLDQRLKIKIAEPKIDLRRRSEAGQSRMR